MTRIAEKMAISRNDAPPPPSRRSPGICSNYRRHAPIQIAHNRLGGMMWLVWQHRSGGETPVGLIVELGRVAAAVPSVHTTALP